MKILLLTVGSRGDVQPCVALGQGLQAAGHQATVCTSLHFADFIRRHGLGYGAMSNALLDLLDTSAGRRAIENTTGLAGTIRTTLRLAAKSRAINQRLLMDSWTAAREAAPDLILYHPKALGGKHIAEKLGIPAMLVLPAPMMVPTGAFPLLGQPRNGLGPRFNRASYTLVALGYRIYARTVNRFRRETLDLGPFPDTAGLFRMADGRPIPVLHCYSSRVVPRPADWPACAHVTGYWFPRSTPAWQPPDSLVRFLEAGEAPVYVGFGSMAGRRPRRLAHIVIRALRQSGRRGILATGWGGLTAENLPATMLPIAEAPHEWLFPRVAAVVHHGGAGTTAAGLRAGRPSVIIPFIADQPFWGYRIHDLGAGPAPIPHRKLSVHRLQRALQTATQCAETRARAARLGRQIQAEDGVARAVELIMRHLAAK